MKKISSWWFHYWFVRKLKEIQDLPFKMKIETEALLSNCTLEIMNEIEATWLAINSENYKLGIKTVQNNRVRISRDHSGKQEVAPNPVFSENQIAEITGKYWRNNIATGSFCVSESFLYSLIAALFVPGGGLFMQIPVAIFLAVVIMLALDYGFERHFTFREMVERHSKKELTDFELKKHADMKILGYILIALSFGAVLFAGFARIFYLEYIPAKGLPHDRVINVTHASSMASILTLLITIITALLMALTKYEQTKLGIRYRVYRRWHVANVRRNNYSRSLTSNARIIEDRTRQIIHKYWQLVIELKRIYKLQTEHDERDGPLHDEYVRLKSQSGFIVTADIYGKFASIQCVYRELFEFGVMNAKEIKDKIAYAIACLKVPEDHIIEHISAVPKTENTKQIFIVPSTNGKAKKH